MTHRVVIRPDARRDLLDASAWYERQRAGLGERFTAAVERTLDAISASPERFPNVYRDVRRALVRPFPYVAIYRIRGEVIHILGVMHGRRDPARWQTRADDA